MRRSFLAPMLALAVLLTVTVGFFSPYAPPVGPYREIEEQWAIEDERQESVTPLVTRLEMDGMPLAYNAQENAFYCPLGLELSDEWPDLHMTAPNARGGLPSFLLTITPSTAAAGPSRTARAIW